LPKSLFLGFSDGLLVIGALLIARYFVSTTTGWRLPELRLYPLKTIVLVLICLFSFDAHDLYRMRRVRSFVDLSLRIGTGTVIALCIVAFLSYFFPVLRIGRRIFMFFCFILPILMILWRFLFHRGLILLRQPKRQVLFLGEPLLAEKIFRAIESRNHTSDEVLGIISCNGLRNLEYNGKLKIIGHQGDLPGILRVGGLTDLVLTPINHRDRFPISTLLTNLDNHLRIQDGVSLYEKITGKLFIDKFETDWFVFSGSLNKSELARGLKRIIEVVVSALALVLLAPFFLLAALLIKLESRGSVLIKQKRVGERGKIFSMYKFRTMRNDAEEGTGPIMAKDGDERITRIGWLMRKTRFDELAQFFNILKGEMSLVGPRPERPYFVKLFSKKIPFYHYRHAIKPGITGWAQINHMYSATAEDVREKILYDFYYIKNLSPLLDLEIILRTIPVVLTGWGAC
jgi:exopolysaccharide biosynthesis polyprenyl glycosylphosphotransferase